MNDPPRPAPFLVRMDERTRARWAEVLEGQRRAGAGIAALRQVLDGGKAVRLGEVLRQFDQTAARLGPVLRQFQQAGGGAGRWPW